MTAAVEAKSLSALTTLASNPPRYPRNPTHDRHEPLVLYIERVPGSKGEYVFLTPMKPRDKVVTAEDVQSSLYYLHFDTPDDDDLKAYVLSAAPPEQAGESPVKDSTPIIRKPVRRPLPSLPPDAPVPALSPSDSIKRKPVVPPPPLSIRIDSENRDNARPHQPHQPVQPTIPSGPTLHRRGRSTEVPGMQQENLRPALPDRRWSAQPPAQPSARGPSPRRPKAELPFWMQDQPRRRKSPAREPESPYSSKPSLDGRPDSGLFSPGPAESGQSMSLTLIRRDPTSGAQWNVGRITDPPGFEIYSDNRGRSVQERVRKPAAPLYIDINNPGYSKFLFNPDLSSPRRSEDSMNSFRSGQAGSRNSFQSPTLPTSVDTTFRRRMWYEGSRYTADYFGHKKTLSNESNLVVPGSSPFGDRSPVEEVESQKRVSMGPQERRSGYRGYVFESPWNGRCEFVTGGAGDSLKCRHILPVTNASVQTPEAVTVSELRFNLPAMRGQPTNTEERTSKRASFLHRKQTPSVSSLGPSAQDILGGVANLDLSLGLEYAGGGFGGKQAKLGKLIIRDEGLKMMDLVVAANMSLWCRAYEKVEAAGRSRHDPRHSTIDVA
ncbi:uncharacterized protein BKCO1_3700019 [Diplodia corticola]|uniref:Oxidoreductase-like protein n=1 Tax=Diplodia corticola TaxID=236234 RepID=A0A1J9QUN2_9PEZI|nr:uncharacterized protein BKCO1_3700019 [Diplodia corticola]OJD32686.1 hypothetical protein BKCO1_3700019 [Diplodia corticola]